MASSFVALFSGLIKLLSSIGSRKMLWMRKYKLQDLNKLSLNTAKMRNKISILFIDDEGFVYESELRSNNFNIKVISDIQDVDFVAKYPVVICDIRGVGAQLGSELEGAHIIREIGKIFPEKIVIGYTGHSFDPKYQAALQNAYAVMRKDADCDEWIEKIDNAIAELLNPIKSWRRLRSRLLDEGMEIMDVMKLEQSYIKSIMNKNPTSFVGLVDNLNNDIAKSVLGAFTEFLLDQILESVK